MLLDLVASVLVPPLCPACGTRAGEGRPVCVRCLARLDREPPVTGSRPVGVSEVASAHHHEGVGRDLLNAFKFRSGASLAPFLAERILERCGSVVLAGTLVPVPSSTGGLAQRGFDPAALLATCLCELIPGTELGPGLLGRAGGSRQLGRSREARLAGAGGIRAEGGIVGPVVLVDDVLTTGATLSASARALRSAGATTVRAVTFSRRV